MVKMLLSILTLITVSSAFSLPFSSDFKSFISYFFSFSIIQIIVYNLYKKYIEVKLENIKNERIREFSKQGLDIKCPCPKSKLMFVPIELNGNNYYKCGECEKNISVQITAKTFMETDMINLDAADAALVEVYKKFKE